MYSVFIADDELHVRQGLKKHFSWDKFNSEVVGEAEDGETALNYIINNNIDIVVTDVKMPLMDGIELAKRVKEYNERIKIVFISGYSEVEYLKSALKIDAIDYILKPIDMAEFENTIKRVVDLIKLEDETSLTLKNLERKINESIPILRDKFFLSLISEKMDSVSVLEEKISFLGLDLPVNQAYCVIVLQVNNYFNVYNIPDERNRQMITYKAVDIFSQILNKHICGNVFESRKGELTGLIVINTVEDVESKLLCIADEVKHALKKELGMEITVGIGRIVQDLMEIRECYYSAITALRNKMTLGSNQSIAVEFYMAKDDKPDNSIKEIKTKLLYSLESGSFSEVRSLLNLFFSEISRSKDMSVIQNELFKLLLLPLNTLTEFRTISDTPYSNLKLLCEHFFCCLNKEDMCSFIQTIYDELIEVLNKKRINSSNIFIAQIKRIIEEKFHMNLSINDIANEVFLSPTYICLLFKQETGVTINDYMTAVRIRKAKELLACSGRKIYDICLSVGYTSPSYFTRLFKKSTGITPSEYRDMVLSDGYSTSDNS